MADWTNLGHIHSRDVLVGFFYLVRPKTTADNGIRFEYNMVTYKTKNRAMLLDNLATDKSICVINTTDALNFKIGAYMRLQDGGLWQIQNFIKDLASGRGKESERENALRFEYETIDTGWDVALIEVENAMGL